jgi:hypothetical protein
MRGGFVMKRVIRVLIPLAVLLATFVGCDVGAHCGIG